MPKTVLITGCSSGFGLCMVKAFLAAKWRVIATTRRPEISAALLVIQQPELITLQLDVTNKNDIEKLHTYIVEKLNNHLDCLINNAGYGLVGIFEELNEAQIRHEIAVNLLGVMWVTQKCLSALRKSKGRIINISSALGYLAMPLQSIYVASKYGLEGFSESLYYELEPHGVQVAIVEPGAFKTKFDENLILPTEKCINDPIYEKQRAGLAKFRQQLKANKSGIPEDLADCVLQLAQSRKMPLRIQLGQDAKLVFWLKRLLPSVFIQFLSRRFYRWMFLPMKSKNTEC